MKKHRIALYLTLAVLLGGCGNHADTPATTTTHTASTTTTVTTTTTSETPSSTINTEDSGNMDNISHTTTNVNATNADSQTTSPVSSTVTTSKSQTTTQHTSVSASSMATTAIGTGSTTTPQVTSTTFVATIRDKQQRLIPGVTVTVYTDTDSGSAVTDRNGVARINLTRSTAYRVVLSNLPAEYEAEPEYRFSSNRVNITLHKAPHQNEADHSEAEYEVGMTMCNFTLTDIYGNTYQLSELQSSKKLIILDFWYVNCTFCVQEFPTFNTVAKAYQDDVILLAINPFDQNSSIQSFREKYKKENGIDLAFPLLRDTCQLAQGFEVTNYPTTVFITSDGIIRDIHSGYFPDVASFRAQIEKHLA